MRKVEHVKGSQLLYYTASTQWSIINEFEQIINNIVLDDHEKINKQAEVRTDMNTRLHKDKL